MPSPAFLRRDVPAKSRPGGQLGKFGIDIRYPGCKQIRSHEYRQIVERPLLPVNAPPPGAVLHAADTFMHFIFMTSAIGKQATGAALEAAIEAEADPVVVVQQNDIKLF